MSVELSKRACIMTKKKKQTISHFNYYIIKMLQTFHYFKRLIFPKPINTYKKKNTKLQNEILKTDNSFYSDSYHVVKQTQISLLKLYQCVIKWNSQVKGNFRSVKPSEQQISEKHHVIWNHWKVENVDETFNVKHVFTHSNFRKCFYTHRTAITFWTETSNEIVLEAHFPLTIYLVRVFTYY